MNVMKTETSAQRTELEIEDITCCHRMTFCSPLFRDILVVEPVCPSWGSIVTWSTMFWITTIGVFLLIGWVLLYLLFGDAMLPLNVGFGLYMLAIISYTLGWSLSYLPHLHLPPVFGMLLGGLITRNAGLFDINEDLDALTTSKLRTFCMTFIMIRVGLQLSLTTLRRYSVFLLILALAPSTVEFIVLSICCRTVLGYPWDWAFMVGTILSCMAPVVTMNSVLSLAEEGYGEDKGLATILCTSACIEDVHLVSLYAVCFSIVFRADEHQTEWWHYAPPGLRDFLLGVVVGGVLGVCFVFFPHRSHKYATWHRLIGLTLGSLMCTIATSNITMSGGGYLAVVVFSFIAITGWRILSTNFQSAPIRKAEYILWHLVQPILVGLIGADIDLSHWTMPRFGLHILCIMLGLMARSSVAYLSSFWTSFNWKERLFIIICWIPKGTLQAALGPMAFERLKQKPENESMQLALDVMKISVVAVMFMAPIGAFAITYTGPLLLNQITAEEAELNYLRKLSLQPATESKKKLFSFIPQPV